MAATIVTVSSKGQLVIPAEIRKKYGIEPGQKFVVVDMGDHISLVPAPGGSASVSSAASSRAAASR